jgi:hypothetical protein
MKKYSILTYNIGGYEILHEVEKQLDDCEYVYVTDDRTITSATWNVVYVENKHPEDNFDLCYTIRFNPFDYVSTDVVIRVDGTTTPCGNTDEIYQTFMDGDYDIGLFIHPERYRFDEELSIWEKYRNYSHEQTERVLSYVRENGYDVEHYLGIFQGNMMIHKNTELNREICEKTLKILKEIHDDGKLIDRLDQVMFTYVVNKFHSDIKVLPLGDNLLNGSYFNMYWHGSNNRIPVRVTSNKKYMFNKEVTPFVFKDCKLKKNLKYYWYVSPNGWNEIYDIHLYNLGLYKNSFDETEFIISFDCGETDLSNVEETINKIRKIFPDAKFTAYQNDKENRESKYFYYEIENKLGQFDDDTAIFFAHNKGLSTTYVTRVDCVSWINLMYYYNLRFMPLVEEALKDENVCAVGHFKMYYPHWDKCKYNWHFPGTFFWMVPSRIKKRLDSEGKGVPTWFDRYSTEGFFGTIFDYDDTACVPIKQPRGEYESIRKWLNDYATDEEKAEYTELYGSVFDNKASLDVFVFTHKPFKIERTNPCYKIVTSSDHEDITSDTAPVIRLNCMLSNVGFSEWQKIFQLFLRPQNLKDYVGLAHFHRYLQFSDDINYIPNMDDEFKKCDCVTKELSYVGNLRQQYANCHNVEDFDIMMKIIDEKFPEYSEGAKLATKNGVLIDSNIMILRKKDFILMCKFVFDVLIEYCNRVGINPSSDESFINYMKAHEEKYSKKHLPNDDEHLQQARICSFLAERLVIIYLTRKKFKLRMYKMVEK